MKKIYLSRVRTEVQEDVSDKDPGPYEKKECNGLDKDQPFVGWVGVGGGGLRRL